MTHIKGVVQAVTVAVLRKMARLSDKVAGILFSWITGWNTEGLQAIPIPVADGVLVTIIANKYLIRELEESGFSIKVSIEGQISVEESQDSICVRISLVEGRSNDELSKNGNDG